MKATRPAATQSSWKISRERPRSSFCGNADATARARRVDQRENIDHHANSYVGEPVVNMLSRSPRVPRRSACQLDASRTCVSRSVGVQRASPLAEREAEPRMAAFTSSPPAREVCEV